MSTVQFLKDLKQGSQEWLDLRRSKITATDASVIMGANHWKTVEDLLEEKLNPNYQNKTNERMQRGIDLEPIARDLFSIKSGIAMEPIVVVKGKQMASLDGMDEQYKNIVEIKCPRIADHNIAVSGKVPDHYFPQLQHQMYVCDLDMAYYFSFDGFDGVIVQIERDEPYIIKMIEEENKFYELMEKLKISESLR